jgi:hypothetical protein
VAATIWLAPVSYVASSTLLMLPSAASTLTRSGRPLRRVDARLIE